MSEKQEECCETCRFWHASHVDENEEMIGECRRYPPSIPTPRDLVKLNFPRDAIHPNTDSQHWCGEYRRANLPLE